MVACISLCFFLEILNMFGVVLVDNEFEFFAGFTFEAISKFFETLNQATSSIPTGNHRCPELECVIAGVPKRLVHVPVVFAEFLLELLQGVLVGFGIREFSPPAVVWCSRIEFPTHMSHYFADIDILSAFATIIVHSDDIGFHLVTAFLRSVVIANNFAAIHPLVIRTDQQFAPRCIHRHNKPTIAD